MNDLTKCSSSLSYVHKLIKENDLINKSLEKMNSNRENYEKK